MSREWQLISFSLWLFLKCNPLALDWFSAQGWINSSVWSENTSAQALLRATRYVVFQVSPHFEIFYVDVYSLFHDWGTPKERIVFLSMPRSYLPAEERYVLQLLELDHKYIKLLINHGVKSAFGSCSIGRNERMGELLPVCPPPNMRYLLYMWEKLCVSPASNTAFNQP